MDDCNLIAFLTPNDSAGLATDAFRLPHNRARYLEPSTITTQDSSRGTTPSDSLDNAEQSNSITSFHRIYIGFDQATKVRGRITFGSDPELCDVLLASKRGQYGISGLHFYLTIDKHNRHIIRDTSTNGLAISYNELAQNERRRNFSWILFHEFKTKTIKVRPGGLAIDIHLPDVKTVGSKSYEEEVKKFLSDTPPIYQITLEQLAFPSRDTSLGPSETLPSFDRPVYLKNGELGHGTFGQVHKVLEASTGKMYAGKEFFSPKGWAKEIDIIRSLDHVWKYLICDLYMQLIADYLKEHVVKFVDFVQVPKPLLVMEYLQSGDLEAKIKNRMIAEADKAVIFSQCLQGLCYLHSRNITHRDLKPENILIQSLSPLSIKIADFGLAQDKPILETFCGSLLYVAPELFLGQQYTNAVDIWSIAVIMLKLVYGHPQTKQPKNLKRQQACQTWGLSWCKELIQSAADWDSDPLIDLLTGHMLRWNPHERLSAADCFDIGIKKGLFSDILPQVGSVTPRSQPDRSPSSIDEAEASIVSQLLWQNVDTPLEEVASTSKVRDILPPLVPGCEMIEPAWMPVESSNDGPLRAMPKELPISRRGQIKNLHAKNDQTNPPTHQELHHGGRASKRRRTDVALDQNQFAQKQPPGHPRKKTAKTKGFFYLVSTPSGNVALRKADFWINVTHLLKASGGSRRGVPFLNGIGNIRYETVRGHHTYQGTYIDFDSGTHVCKILGLPDVAKLLCEARDRLRNGDISDSEPESEQKSENFLQVQYQAARTITFDLTDGSVSLTNLFEIFGLSSEDLRIFMQRNLTLTFKIVKGKHRGTYTGLSTAYDLCDVYGYQSLKNLLQATQRELETRKDHKPSNLATQQAELPSVNNPLLDSTVNDGSFVQQTGDSCIRRNNLDPQSIVWQSHNTQ